MSEAIMTFSMLGLTNVFVYAFLTDPTVSDLPQSKGEMIYTIITLVWFFVSSILTIGVFIWSELL